MSPKENDSRENDPKLETRLTWKNGERFHGSVGQTPVVLDGSSAQDLSPMQAVAAGLAGCMAIDVAMILEKGRQPVERLEVELAAARAQDPPRRFTAVELRFRVVGAVEAAKVERAIELSRETYCSVWHSLRRDIELETSFEVVHSA